MDQKTTRKKLASISQGCLFCGILCMAGVKVVRVAVTSGPFQGLLMIGVAGLGLMLFLSSFCLFIAAALQKH